jgi:DNA-binding beta-propeller fold protein YncE
MVIFILFIFSQIEVRINKKYDPFEWEKLAKKYNVKSYVLGNVKIDLKGEKLIPIKICEKPSIPKFTLSVAREYYEKDIFKGLAGIALIDVPYKITLPGITPRIVEGISEVIMGVDYRWKRVIFGRRGDPNFYAFGSFGEEEGKWLEPWDIEVSFPYVYITDPWSKRICVWKVIIDTLPNGDYFFTGFSFYKDIGKDILGFPQGIGIYRNDPENPDDDLIYVADRSKARIFTFDKEGNFLRVFGKTWRAWPPPPPGYFSFPSDVEVDLNGNVYVIDDDYLIGYRDTFISNEPFYFRYFKFPPYSLLQGLAIDDKGNVYVGWIKRDDKMTFLDCKIVKFYPELIDSVWSYGKKGFDLGEFPRINDIYIKGAFMGVSEDWGEKRGLAYFLIPDAFKDTIPPFAKFLTPPDSTYINGKVPIRINVKDNYYLKGYRIFYANWETPNELKLIFDGTQQGEVFAGYWDVNNLEEDFYFLYLDAFDFANNYKSDTLLLYIGEPYPFIYFGNFGKDKGEFRLPCDLTSDSEFIYVCDTQNDRIQKFDKKGNFIFSFGKHGRENGEFMQCNFISLKDNKIYVSDQYNHRIQVFDTDFNFIFSFGDKKLFNQPGGLSFDYEGNVYVSDIHNHKIHKFSSEGEYIKSFGKYGFRPGEFNQPHGIFILDSIIYIVDRQNNRIQVFNLKGEFITLFGKEGEERGEFKHPYDIVIDKDSSLYVSDQHNNRIQKFDKFGDVLLTIYGEKLPYNLKQPTGLSIDDKYLYVVDMYNSRIVVYPLKIFEIDQLSKYNVSPNQILILQNPIRDKLYFVINVSENYSYVLISIYEISGRKIEDILKGYYSSGKKMVIFDVHKFKSGNYFLKGKIGNKDLRKKIIILK